MPLMNPFETATKVKLYLLEQKEDKKYDRLAGPVRRINPVQKKFEIPESEMSSGAFIDSSTNINQATYDQKDLLSKAGLTIKPDSLVYTVRDKSGNLKGALAVNKEKDKKQINYISADEDDNHIARALTKIDINPGTGYNMSKQETILVKEEINPIVLIHDKE